MPGSIRTKKFVRPDEGWSYPYKPVNRGLRLLHPRRTGKRKEQYNRRWRESNRGAVRVLDPDGKRDNSARSGTKRAKIPARGRRS